MKLVQNHILLHISLPYQGFVHPVDLDIKEYTGWVMCHTPIPGPTRLANPNRVPGRETIYGTLYLIFFFKSRTCTCGYGPHLITESRYHIHIKRTTTGVVSIKIYTHLSSSIYKYKTVLLHLQIRARNLHVVNPYKCVGLVVCGCFQTSSPVPTRIKNPC